MALINGKVFGKITRRYHCDDEVLRQIREFITTTMMPDEDIVLNHCIVTVIDRSKRLLTFPKNARYFDVAFSVMYYEVGSTFVGEPVFEITYEAAEELSKDEYERRKEKLPNEELLIEAKEIINSNL